MRPHHLLQVSFVCKTSVAHFVRISILSLATMAATLQLATVSPVSTTSSLEVIEGHDVISSYSAPKSQKSVKVGCCACVRRRKNCEIDAKSKHPQNCRLKNHQNNAKGCIRAYLRFVWIDTVLLALFGFLMLGLHFAPNNLRDPPLMPFWTQVPVAGNITGQNLDLRAPIEFLYPHRKTPLSDLACAVIVTIVPIVIIAIFQLRVCSIWDFHAGQVGILKAVTTT